MIIVMRPGASMEDIGGVEAAVREEGCTSKVIYDGERRMVTAIGDPAKLREGRFATLPGVERVMRVAAPYKLASRETKDTPTVVRTHPRAGTGASVASWGGSEPIAIIAGPCTVEDRSQILESAVAAKEAGAVALRGGAFKPRTNPYSFQGLMEEGLEYLAEAREKTGLPVVTEVLTPEDVRLVAKYADVLQIGARNMQNFLLLRECGLVKRPVLIKRGLSSTLEELIFAAEYVLSQGNPDVILCERGVRTFENHTRNTLSLSMIPAVKKTSHLPIVVDPSHGTGHAYMVAPMSKAAVAAGADGLVIEVAPDPKRAMVDGSQTLDFKQFATLVKELDLVARAVGRSIARLQDQS